MTQQEVDEVKKLLTDSMDASYRNGFAVGVCFSLALVCLARFLACLLL